MTRLEITEGVVLGKRISGEANTVIYVLTERLGLLRAAARSARKEQSKLRYGLEPFTAARFTFVRGKSEWKMIGAERISRELVLSGAKNRAAAGRIARLLTRLIQGEEPAAALFQSVSEGLTLIARADARALESVECVLVLRILFNLGYLPKTPELAPFVADEALSLELAAQAARSRSALIRAINESLSATGL